MADEGDGQPKCLFHDYEGCTKPARHQILVGGIDMPYQVHTCDEHRERIERVRGGSKARPVDEDDDEA